MPTVISEGDWKRITETVVMLMRDMKAAQDSERLKEVYGHTLQKFFFQLEVRLKSKRLLVSSDPSEPSDCDGLPADNFVMLRKKLLREQILDHRKIEDLIRKAAVGIQRSGAQRLASDNQGGR